MKERRTGLQIAASVARGADKALDGFIVILLVIALLYSGFGLWDTYRIYAGAGIDSELLKYKPSMDGDNLSLAELQLINPDVCGWLTIDDTGIDYPVVQGETNMEYINKNVYGEFSLSGSVFLDSRNSPDFSDRYSLLYAHHIEGNVMFGELPAFMEQTYFEGHTSGILFLPDRTYRIEIFACLYTDAYDAMAFNPTMIGSEADAEAFLSYLKKESVQYRDVGVGTSDQIIGLSTCSEASTNGRVLLFGRLSEYEPDIS